jgi:hypothetical protein
MSLRRRLATSLLVAFSGPSCSPTGGYVASTGAPGTITTTLEQEQQPNLGTVPNAEDPINSDPNDQSGINPSGDMTVMPPTTGTQIVNTIPVDFGPNVLIFDATMEMSTIQSRLNNIYGKQNGNHFGPQRYHYLFKPGDYNLDVQIGFFMTAAGLGVSPDDVTIKGAVRSKATWFSGNATQNFWRGVENLSVVPTQDNGKNVWAVSQGVTMRRVHIKGAQALSDNGWSSGGFIADSKFDAIDSGTQQQFLTRNCDLTRWQGHNWNMVFVGDKNTPSGNWPDVPYTFVNATPIIREKPFLAMDGNNYVVMYPTLKKMSQGPSWTGDGEVPMKLPINQFYIAHAESDNADTINAALKQGLHLIITPGIYKLTGPLNVTAKNTIVLGLGIATLFADKGTPVLNVADVDGVSISGILVDAGPTNSPTLLTLGTPGNTADHSANPTHLYDVSCRVGGIGTAKTTSCITVHSNNVVLDNTWLWRADHGDGAGWYSNPSINGIIINGNGVTAYGLFSEHFQGYQTLWNGNNGATYMYQSEFPYDPPNQSSWSHDGVNGYASYKVANNVTKHIGQGMGMYCVFANTVAVQNGIESPKAAGVKFNHLLTEWLGVADDSVVTHIINDTGAAATKYSRHSQTNY